MQLDRSKSMILTLVGVWMACGVAGCGAVSSHGESEGARSFRFTYSVLVQNIPEGARDVSIWIPIPKSGPYQTVSDVKVESPYEHRIETDPRHGNSILHVSANAPFPGEVELQMVATIVREAYSVLGSQQPRDAASPTPADLQPDKLVPVDGIIRDLAKQATRDSQTQLEKARAIYDYVTETMSYDKSGEGWGRGDALYACDARTGNCTDFHSLIIGMARASDIPARFVMGFPLPETTKKGEIPGYHCWAELYIEGIGWLPVDSSEASKHPEKRDAFFGGLDANRVQFTTGRDLELVPKASETLNYFVYPHVEVDGRKHAAVKRSFSFVEVDA